MKPKRTWILIADGAHARIAFNEGPGKGLRPALDHEFAAPHVPTAKLVSDRPGRQSDRGLTSTHPVEPRTDRHEYEKWQFVRDVAKVVNKAAESGKFDRLVLVAPPATLGRLRAALAPRTREMVAAEIGKDLTHVPLHAIPGYLKEAITI